MRCNIRGRTDRIVIRLAEKVTLVQLVSAIHFAVELHPVLKLQLHMLQKQVHAALNCL